MFLAKQISQELRVFMENTATHPHGMTMNEWCSKLEDIATRLEEYADNKFSSLDNEQNLTIRAQSALRSLADVFPYLWD